MARARRRLSRSKTYGFHPWMDQVDAIDQIVKETGVKDSIVLRKLIDEALVARHKKVAEQEHGRRRASRSETEAIESLETVLSQVLRQGEVSLRVQDAILSILQENLAETRAGRKAAWEQLTEGLRQRGVAAREISKRFDQETSEAKNFAYSTAKEIKRRQKR